MNFRLDIQGLRALAVLFVVIFHLQHQWLPGGFIGVDMFFVISGYLISKSVIAGVDDKTFSFYRFFEGRVKRIVPTYFVMLLITIVLAAMLFIATDFTTFFHQLKRTVFFVSNELFAKTDSYFGAKSFENPLLHTWSLSIEMQFYLFLPIVIYILPKSWRNLIIVLAFLSLLGYTEYKLQIENKKSEMYFSLLARSIEFMIGIGINLLPKFKLGKFNEPLSFLSITTIFLSAIFINENSLFPGLMSLPACFATAYLIFAEDTIVNKALSLPLFTYIGKISYSLYLYHWPVLSLYRYYTMRYDLTALEIVSLILIFTLLSVSSFYLIEEKYRKLKGKKFLLYFGMLSISLVGVWSVSLKLNSYFFNIPEKYVSPKAFNNNNHNQYLKYELLGLQKEKDDRILIVGDSHGLGILPFMDLTGKQYGFNFSSITMNHYPPLPGLAIDRLTKTIDLKAYQELSVICDSLIKKSRIIVLVKYWEGPSDFSEASDYIYQIMRTDQALVILSDIPHLEQNPVRKYKSLTKPKSFTSENLILQSYSKEVITFVKNKANVYFFDIYDKEFFKQSPYLNDTLIYIDESHINLFGSQKLSQYKGREFALFLDRVINNFN